MIETVMPEFLGTVVETPLGVILTLGLLPTGDVLRLVTGWIDRVTPATAGGSRGLRLRRRQSEKKNREGER